MRTLAKSAAKFISTDVVRVDHADFVETDVEWLREVRSLTLWNVRFPQGFLSWLPALRELDIRGGSRESLDFLIGCDRLEMLLVNQVRGLSDLKAIIALADLKLLSLYGLPRVEMAPSFKGLKQPRRLELGSMKGLRTIEPCLDAPNLTELLIIRKMGNGSVDPGLIRKHASLRYFEWFGEDVPDKVWHPVVEAVGLPKPANVSHVQWMQEYRSKSGEVAGSSENRPWSRE